MVWKFLFVFISYQTVKLLLLIIIQKTEVTFFEGNEYNFDDIDKPMLKKKSWRRVQDNCLKAKNFFQDR
jgi:hypothetical protein